MPLSYVIQDSAIGDFEESYDSHEERLVSCITQYGTSFKSDNIDIFLILLQYTENKEWYILIESQEKRLSSRQVWLSLLSHFNVNTFKVRAVQEANTIFCTIIYHGSHKYFHLEITILVIVRHILNF